MKRLQLVPVVGVLLWGCGGIPGANLDCVNGEQAVRSSEYPAAIELLTKCLATSDLGISERARALKFRAWAHQTLRHDPQAVADEEAAFAIDPRFEYRDYINLAMYLRRVGRYEDSLRALRSAEGLDTANDHPGMMTQYHIGWTLSALGRYDEAIAAFSRGVPDQPDYPFVYWRRGLAYEALHQLDKAHADFELFAKKLLASEAERSASLDMVPEFREKLKQYGLDKRYVL